MEGSGSLPLINTGLQPGDHRLDGRNRFNGLSKYEKSLKRLNRLRPVEHRAKATVLIRLI